MYVNMVRIGSLLTQDTLSRGRTIDTIEIYALVVVHYEKQGVPTKYHVDFEKHMRILHAISLLHALEALHRAGFAHLDVRIPNICFKVNHE